MAAGTEVDDDAAHPKTGVPVVQVFGGMGVTGATGPVSIGGPRQRRLLALLTLRAGSVVSIDWLAEHLWSDDDRSDDPAPALRTCVSRLRQALPEAAQGWLTTQPGGYRLDAPDSALEHLLFAQLRAQATTARRRGDPLSGLTLLGQALDLWRGDPFQELEQSDASRVDSERLRLERMEMLEEHWECSLALGRHTQITGELAVFTAEHRHRDRATRQYALALYRSGRTPEALRVVADHREFVTSGSGLDPSAEMIELEQQMLTGDSALDIEKVGRPLRDYRLLDEIGSGAFSIVWRGMQPSVGREVAIKQIRSDLASQPEFIRRFEAEAHLVARIEHPHIVPLIDFWRDPDSAYLVMRLLRGGTLEERLDDGPMDVGQALTLANEIGGALGAAHERGVIHRDVKTGNIMFDESGHAFLGDFGIALEAAHSTGPAAAFSTGSPAYSAPEQIRREPLGPQADVFSLGVVLFECLTGTLPFAGSGSASDLVDHQLHSEYPLVTELRPEVASHIAEAITKATAKDPADRFPTAGAFVAALSIEASGAHQLDEQPLGLATNLPNPYLGLRAFDEADRDNFFGREILINTLIGQFKGNGLASRCVAVVGPSGSGKSSVVRAGLSPAIRHGAVNGSDQWLSTTMVPGVNPYESLEAALLRIAVNPPASLLDQLRDGRSGILRCLRRCLVDDLHKVYLVIDQFEELFTASDEQVAFDFLDALAVAVEDAQSPLRLVFTLRADYYDRPLGHPSFAGVLDAAAVNVTPLSGDELERAMVEPAQRLGVGFEPGLVALLVADCIGQPAPLPLLQYALSEVFDRRASALLTIASYEDMGRLTGALATRAESIHSQADDSQRAAIRRSFGRMTSPGEDTADLRRRVRLSDLGDDPSTAWVLQQFGDARLLSFDRDPATREPTVEVAHEALLREWPRLVGWLQDDAAVLRSADAVAASAESWEDAGREDADLLRAGRLETARGVAQIAPERLRSLDHEFIDSSQAFANVERNNEQKRVSRLRRLVGLATAALVVALLAAGLAFFQRNQAQDATTQAELATLISTSAAQTADDPEVALLLALEANRRAPGPPSERAVLNALGSSSILNRIASRPLLFGESEECGTVALASGELLDTGIHEGQLATRDALTGQITTYGPPPAPCVRWDLDPVTGRRFALFYDSVMWSGAEDGVWDTRVDFSGSRVPVTGFIGSRRMLFESTPDGITLAMILMDVVSGEDIGEPIVGGDDFFGARVSPDGSLIAIGFGIRSGADGHGLTLIVDGETGRELFRIQTPVPFGSFEFDESTAELVASAADGSIATIDLETTAIIATVASRATSPIADIGIGPDGLIQVVSAGQFETVDRRTGPVGDTLGLRNIDQATIRPDGLLNVFTTQERLDVIDPRGSALVQNSHEVDPFAETWFTPGWVGAVKGPVGDPTVINLATGERTVVELTTPQGARFAPTIIYPDASGLWAVNGDGELARWEDGLLVTSIDLDGRPQPGYSRYLDRLATITQGTTSSATTTFDRTRIAHLVNLGAGDANIVFSVQALFASALHPSLDGGLHIIDLDGRLRTFDPSGEQINVVDTGVLNAQVMTIDKSTGRLAVAGFSGAHIVDPSTGDTITLPTTDGVRSIGFARNGELLVLTSNDGTVRIFEVDSDNAPTFAWDGSGSSTRSSPWYDEATDSIWVTSSGKVLEIPLDPQEWIQRACEIVGRNLTQDEWDRFVPGDDARQPACA